jgi:hypothetical protein
MWYQATLQEQKKMEYLKVKINELETNSNIELSKFYYHPMHKGNALKGMSKFTLKMLQHVSV